jgi:large subunit ribosomal protein L9
MKVILLKDIPNIGRKYEIKNVADGMAINMLIPRGQAQVATTEAIKRVEREVSLAIIDKNTQDILLAKDLEKLSSLIIEVKEKANEKGHLFASIRKEDLMEKIKAQTKLNISSDHILMEKPIKEVGEFVIPLKVGEKRGSVKLVVEAL